MEKEKNIAMLIDADNISYAHIKEMTDELARYGNLTIKRIYGDWTNQHMNGWKDVLLKNAIIPIQQYSYTTGKNSTDSAMIIDAMDILYSGHVDIFCLVSSDSDFTRLAMRLREEGKEVIGIGYKRTPQPFIVACNKFIHIEVLSPVVETPIPLHPISPEEDRQHQPNDQKTTFVPTIERETTPHFLSLIQDAIDAVADDSGWSALGNVGNLLIKKDPAFDTRAFGFKKLSTLIESYSDMFDMRKINSFHIIVRRKNNK